MLSLTELSKSSLFDFMRLIPSRLMTTNQGEGLRGARGKAFILAPLFASYINSCIKKKSKSQDHRDKSVNKDGGGAASWRSLWADLSIKGSGMVEGAADDEVAALEAASTWAVSRVEALTQQQRRQSDKANLVPIRAILVQEERPLSMDRVLSLTASILSGVSDLEALVKDEMRGDGAENMDPGGSTLCVVGKKRPREEGEVMRNQILPRLEGGLGQIKGIVDIIKSHFDR